MLLPIYVAWVKTINQYKLFQKRRVVSEYPRFVLFGDSLMQVQYILLCSVSIAARLKSISIDSGQQWAYKYIYNSIYSYEKMNQYVMSKQEFSANRCVHSKITAFIIQFSICAAVIQCKTHNNKENIIIIINFIQKNVILSKQWRWIFSSHNKWWIMFRWLQWSKHTFSYTYLYCCYNIYIIIGRMR